MKPHKKASEMTTAELGRYIDQSVLKPEFTLEEVKQHIQEGIDYKCKTVCINPVYLPVAREMCRDTETGICVVCDFPFGASSTASKVEQAITICREGDIEDLDVVANYGFIRSGLWKEFEDDIRAVANAAHQHGTLLKVIFETDALTPEQVAKATEHACQAGADFVKTSTGFYTGGDSRGATPEIIQVMLDVAKGRCKVKGSGSIRTREHFLQLIDMGIDRMGIGYRSTAHVLGLDESKAPAGSSSY
ncbi:deoxyribose-phosphate aldolase [Pectobacterium carotovorum]|uniref:deoxyribose-phosphate aldolase n=1 Tax=Pectobacterium carotovorum TaxID=554 RepID=UPI0010FDE3B8|nr:deoxyribose-phosphate aldolase [Pectobacterium carotovorum]KAA3667347.1 deoxyribose-phosphate aldolase [Pectobacterium carotovorum subsp. carotovorum]